VLILTLVREAHEVSAVSDVALVRNNRLVEGRLHRTCRHFSCWLSQNFFHYDLRALLQRGYLATAIVCQVHLLLSSSSLDISVPLRRLQIPLPGVVPRYHRAGNDDATSCLFLH
jgi:hypothetical protein